ncbi:hypothetical protein GQ600_25173 [Phytophthora cactorum]|nr:hypothetical protein GQ600_25173 [Phytophthora cactorum]
MGSGAPHSVTVLNSLFVAVPEGTTLRPVVTCRGRPPGAALRFRDDLGEELEESGERQNRNGPSVAERRRAIHRARRVSRAFLPFANAGGRSARGAGY